MVYKFFNPQTFTISNVTATNGETCPPVVPARLTIGVTGKDGSFAELVFERDEANNLVAIDAPTEDELNQHYLEVNGWERAEIHGLGTVWSDPIGGGDYKFENALDVQTARDLRDFVAEGNASEDDRELLESARQLIEDSVNSDYRIANRPDNPNWQGLANWFDEIAARYQNDETPLAEMLGGE